jgi:hypothetical protein
LLGDERQTSNEKIEANRKANAAPCHVWSFKSALERGPRVYPNWTGKSIRNNRSFI